MTQSIPKEAYDWWLKVGTQELWAYKDNVFSDIEIELINMQSPKTESYLGKVGSNKAVERLDYRNSTISHLSSSTDENVWVFEAITRAIVEINDQFWNFDLNRIETLQHSVYSKGQFYKPHIDSIYNTPNNAVRKLSFSVQLTDSDEYDGGDLLIHTGSDPMPTSRKKGTIVFFPSFMVHEVAKVTRGTRKALVGWVSGPPFK